MHDLKPKAPGVSGWTPQHVTSACGWIAMSIGLLSLVGWIIDLPILTSVRPEWVSMKVNTAIGVIWAGTLLVGEFHQAKSKSRWKHWAALLSPILLLAFGISLASEHLLGWDLGIDTLFVSDNRNSIEPQIPGRTSLMASINFAAIGMACVASRVGLRISSSLMQYSAIFMGFTATSALLSYLFQVEQASPLQGTSSLALQSSLSFLVIAIGILTSTRGYGLMHQVFASNISAMMTRRLIVPATVIPIVRGLYQSLVTNDMISWEIDSAVFTAGVITIFLWSISKSSSIANNIENALNVANVSLQQKVMELEHANREIVAQQEKSQYNAKMAALGEMAGNIAHEINTPLSIIVSRANQINRLLSHLPTPPTKPMEFATTIEATGFRISSIVNGLKAFSRNALEDGFEHVGFGTIVSDTLALCTEKFKSEGTKLSVSLPPTQIVLECSATQISQVLLNLLNNANEAISGSMTKWIKLEVSETANHLEIALTDSGLGIPTEVQARIFDPFYSTKAGHGTGLGLSISKGLVEAHGGSIRIDTTCANTKFVVTLPLRQLAKTERAIPQAA